MIDFYAVSVLIFVIILAVIVYRDRKKFTRDSIFLLRKTQTGRKFLTNLSDRFPRFWKHVGTIGVVVSLIGSLYGFVLLLNLFVKSIFAERAVGGMAVLLPTPTASPIIAPGVLGVPFWYWIISIALLVVVHEGSHGIQAIRAKVPIKSLGWGILLIIPLAFVEPDEKMLQKKKSLHQLRVFGAGSFANFVLAGVILVILAVVSSNIMVASGVQYYGLIQNYSAFENNMTGKIVSLNGIPVMDDRDLSEALEITGVGRKVQVVTFNGTTESTYEIETRKPPEYEYVPNFDENVMIGMEHLIPGITDVSESFGKSLNAIGGAETYDSWSSLSMQITKWEYIRENYPALRQRSDSKLRELNVKLLERSEPGYIGIYGVSVDYEVIDSLKPYEEPVLFTNGLLFFVFLINLGVGIANMLPVKPLDGGRMWEIIFRRFSKRHYKTMTKALGYITFFLIIAAFAMPFIKP
ncbi:MAG: site-2 protease family protein [Candidatus Aenigmarchaeota archaeon]|nr:site-2 protease family protein [Candidatus Aenigmarchaeota archaeon]